MGSILKIYPSATFEEMCGSLEEYDEVSSKLEIDCSYISNENIEISLSDFYNLLVKNH